MGAAGPRTVCRLRDAVATRADVVALETNRGVSGDNLAAAVLTHARLRAKDGSTAHAV